MNHSTRKRPMAVWAIGCFWIIAGGFLLLSSIHVYQHPSFDMLWSEEMVKRFPPLAFMNRHYLLMPCFFMFTIGAVAIISAISFLRLRVWARTALEVVSWLEVAHSVFGTVEGVCFEYFGMKTSLGSALFAFMENMFFLAPLALSICLLRSKKVRDVLAHSRGESE